MRTPTSQQRIAKAQNLLTRRQAIAGLGGVVAAAVATGASPATADPREIVAAATRKAPAAKSPEVLKRITLSDPHLWLTQVILQDQTDRHNELVQLREWPAAPDRKARVPGKSVRAGERADGRGPNPAQTCAAPPYPTDQHGGRPLSRPAQGHGIRPPGALARLRKLLPRWGAFTFSP
jgi:hypothetical protein